MTDWQWYDYMRLATAMFAVLSAYRLGRLVRDRWSKLEGVDLKIYAEFVWILFAVFFVFFSGSIEAITRNGTYRYSALISFLIMLAAVRATRKSDSSSFSFLNKSEDYTACGFPIRLNDTVSGYCDKAINDDHMHSDNNDLHHMSVVYTNSGRLYQG